MILSRELLVPKKGGVTYCGFFKIVLSEAKKAVTK